MFYMTPRVSADYVRTAIYSLFYNYHQKMVSNRHKLNGASE